MNNTLGAPSRARVGAGHAGLDTSKVRPITPGNAWPALYSFSDIDVLLVPSRELFEMAGHDRRPRLRRILCPAIVLGRPAEGHSTAGGAVPARSPRALGSCQPWVAVRPEEARGVERADPIRDGRGLLQLGRQ